MRPIAFAIPGDLASLTGGYAYDRELAAHLPAAGWMPEVVPLADGFPFPTTVALRDAESRLSAVPKGRPILIDGLAYGALGPGFLRQSGRQWIALVHHPLALETGLTPDQAHGLRENETHALAEASLVIATSPYTLRNLREDYGVSADRLCCALPGTVRPAASHGCRSRTSPSLLLTVASLIPRKAHDVLVDALARIQDLPWRAMFVGDTARDTETAANIRKQIEAHNLTSRITLTGPMQGDALDAVFGHADTFVLPSRHEGYGMVLAEALAHGLPIVACAAGATIDTVPPDAGCLVPPNDPEALATALRRLLTDEPLHADLSRAAWQHGQKLPTWSDTAAAVGAALDTMRPR